MTGGVLQALEEQDQLRGLGKVLSMARELQTQKGGRSWHQTIKQQGVQVYGAPMPDHQPRAFTEIGPVPIIVVDNSVPESTQGIAIVQQYFHLKLGHSSSALEAEGGIAVALGALAATLPRTEPELGTYLRENPEMEKLWKTTAIMGAVTLGVIIVAAAIKGVLGWVKR